jgi:hypothetical protein
LQISKIYIYKLERIWVQNPPQSSEAIKSRWRPQVAANLSISDDLQPPAANYVAVLGNAIGRLLITASRS